MRTRSLVAVALGLLAVPGLGMTATAGASELQFVATPSVALYGEPFAWKVAGLGPGGEVTVRAASL